MPIKRVHRRTPTTRGAAERTKPSTKSLPTERTVPETDMRKYLGLLYGREKIGKTVTFAQAPDTLFLTTEPGTKGLSIYEIPVHSWQDFKDAVSALQKEKRFDMVVIDTADRAYDLCLDHVCAELGIPHPGQDSFGKEDYGKSWKAVKRAFLEEIYHIIQTGRGLWFTSHFKQSEERTRSGETHTRIVPSMGKQARSVIEALVDIILYAEFVRNSRGQTVRVLFCEGDESIWAGARPPAKFPPILPLVKGRGFEVIKEGFAGQHAGLDPATLLPPTSKAGKPVKNLLGKLEKKEVRRRKKR